MLHGKARSTPMLFVVPHPDPTEQQHYYHLPSSPLPLSMISGTVSVNNYHYHQLVKDADVQLLTSTHANKIAELWKEGLYLVFQDL